MNTPVLQELSYTGPKILMESNGEGKDGPVKSN